MALSLPPPTQPFTHPAHADNDPARLGYITEPWYRIVSEISRIRSELDALKRLTQGMGAMDATFVTTTVTFVGST